MPMPRVARKVKDRRVLALIGKYLRVGAMVNGRNLLARMCASPILIFHNVWELKISRYYAGNGYILVKRFPPKRKTIQAQCNLF